MRRSALMKQQFHWPLAVLISSATASILAVVPFQEDDDASTPTCSVVVFDANGAPLLGARCWVSAFEQRTTDGWRPVMRSGQPRLVFTDAEGRATLECFADELHDVDIDASGLAPARAHRLAVGEERTVRLVRGHTVSGRVVQRIGDESRPCGHGRIALRQPNDRGLWFDRESSCDADGVFTFEGFLPPPQPVRSDVGASATWQLECGGATFDLGASALEPVDDLVIEIAIERRP